MACSNIDSNISLKIEENDIKCDNNEKNYNCDKDTHVTNDILNKTSNKSSKMQQLLSNLNRKTRLPKKYSILWDIPISSSHTPKPISSSHKQKNRFVQQIIRSQAFNTVLSNPKQMKKDLNTNEVNTNEENSEVSSVVGEVITQIIDILKVLKKEEYHCNTSVYENIGGKVVPGNHVITPGDTLNMNVNETPWTCSGIHPQHHSYMMEMDKHQPHFYMMDMDQLQQQSMMMEMDQPPQQSMIMDFTQKTTSYNPNVEKIPSKIKISNETKNINLLHFEDDTFRAIIKIPNEKIKIINEWYDKCSQIIDIEDIDVTIPDLIKPNELQSILFKNINYKHKDIFINSFIPEIFNEILTREKIVDIANTMSLSIEPKYYNKETNDYKPSITTLNIFIPTNMYYTEKYYYKQNSKIIPIDKYNKSSQLPVSDIHKKVVVDEIKSYNEVFNTLNPDGVHGDEIKSYNDEYNTLNPEFGLNCGNIDCEDSVEEIDTKLIIVIFNTIFNQTLVVVDPSLITLEIIHDHIDYGFLELFTIKCNDDSELESLINKQYDRIIFNNIEELNKTILSTSQMIELIQTKHKFNASLIEEAKTVKSFLKNRYKISSDINHKMKASVIYDIIIKDESCIIDKLKISDFKNRLSVYLKDIGLQKKRYNDGYYYYGIVDKYDSIVKPIEIPPYNNYENISHLVPQSDRIPNIKLENCVSHSQYILREYKNR